MQNMHVYSTLNFVSQFKNVLIWQRFLSLEVVIIYHTNLQDKYLINHVKRMVY